MERTFCLNITTSAIFRCNELSGYFSLNTLLMEGIRQLDLTNETQGQWGLGEIEFTQSFHLIFWVIPCRTQEHLCSSLFWYPILFVLRGRVQKDRVGCKTAWTHPDGMLSAPTPFCFFLRQFPSLCLIWRKMEVLRLWSYFPLLGLNISSIRSFSSWAL